MACGNYKHLCTCGFAVKCIHVCNTQKSRRHSFRHPGIAKYQHHCLMLLLRKMAIMTELWLWSKWVYAVLLLLLLLLHFKGKQNNWNDDTVTYKLDGCKSDIASFQYLLSAFHTHLLLTIFNVYKLFVLACWYYVSWIKYSILRFAIPSRIIMYFQVTYYPICLQCFDAVGWAAERASGL